MAIFSTLRFLVVVLCALVALCHAAPNEVFMGGFHMKYGLTGCLGEPTRDCVDGSNGDTCYNDRNLDFSITGTAPICSACMPKNYRNIATYSYPLYLPCALWRYYGCDDYFVTHVWEKSGSNGCVLGGMKSYNMRSISDDEAGSEQEYIKNCRKFKTFADYGLPNTTTLINERDFCSPVIYNLTMSDPTQKLLPSYADYYLEKYGNQTKSE